MTDCSSFKQLDPNGTWRGQVGLVGDYDWFRLDLSSAGVAKVDIKAYPSGAARIQLVLNSYEYWPEACREAVTADLSPLALEVDSARSCWLRASVGVSAEYEIVTRFESLETHSEKVSPMNLELDHFEALEIVDPDPDT